MGILLVPFKVFPINQGLCSLLQVRRSDGKLELDEQLLHQQLMTQALACLHDPNYGRIDLHHKPWTVARDVTVS